jgi:hypothetical protein
VETTHWLQNIDWQTKFLSMVLHFTKDPSRKTLRPLIELYSPDRDRMKVEAEILERQLKHRLATFAQPDDATVRKAIMKNEQRVLAVYLHVRSGYRGIDVARFFKVPRTTAYVWLEWFKNLPEGVQTGILEFMDTQVPIMAAYQVPAVIPKAAAARADGQQGAAAKDAGRTQRIKEDAHVQSKLIQRSSRPGASGHARSVPSTGRGTRTAN